MASAANSVKTKAVKTSNPNPLFIDCEIPAICQLWAYRLLLKKKLLRGHYDIFSDLSPEELEKIGISEQAQYMTPNQLERSLALKVRALDQDANTQIPAALANNIAHLAHMVGLSAFEQHLLALMVLIKMVEPLNQVCTAFRVLKIADVENWLALTLACPVPQVRAAIGTRSPLISSGLMTLEPSIDFSEAFDFINVSFPRDLMQENQDPNQLMRDIVQLATPATLGMADYPHIAADLGILIPYLRQALAQQQPGVNILIYGPPGTGKSELTRVVAQQLDLSLFEVSSEDDEGDPISGGRRMRAYRFAQRYLSSKPNLLLFDETEDVFSQNPFSREFEQRKCWLNRILEQNPVPSFWLTNDVTTLDNAAIRRFDLVIELPTLPLPKRAELLQKAAGGFLTPDAAHELAQHADLTPAIITRAAKVVGQVGQVAELQDQSQQTQALQLLMERTLTAQGFALKKTAAVPLNPVYDPALINSDIDLTTLVTGLQQAGSARLCFYGPPGTGKTAFCHYLAQSLGRPLLVKPASELLSCYLGETEQLIAAAFAEAKSLGAILLLDEVDSFLQERSKAQRTWEITQVNELLLQMEAFQGIFVATTNLMQQLDQASLRRFDLKVCFQYLQPEQACDLLHAHCKNLGLTASMADLKQLQSALQLTPGDFQAVARQHRFLPFASGSAFVEALLKDTALKGGFMTTATSTRLQ